MKVLIINGSPRRNGKIQQMMAYAESVGGTGAELVNLYDLKISPCRACMQCREGGACILPQDDAHLLAEKINRADLLIIGSPTHWGNMSSALKTMFDRMVCLFMGEGRMGIPIPKQKGKKAIIVVTCTTPYPFNIFFRQSRGAVHAIGEVLKTAGYSVRSIEIPGTKGMERLPEKYLKRLRKQM